MFFARYLRCELRSRARQAVMIALGLAVGVGLVVIVMAASSGVQQAQGRVLTSLYGVGTDVTVTKPPAANPNHAGGVKITAGSGGVNACTVGGSCNSGAQTIDNLTSPANGPIGYSSVAGVSRLNDVTAAAGGLNLSDTQITIPADIASGASGSMPQPKSFTVTGVDVAHQHLGPLSNGSITAGHGFAAADANADDAVVDSGYASSNSLKPGSKITIAKHTFTVIGIVTQPQGSNQPEVYIPLARAQALGTSAGQSLANDVNTIYVTAASAADIPAVQHEISALLPSATITTPSSVASEVTGSLSSTAKLAGDLGRWLSVLVLVAAFAVAALLTLAAITRRVREFGTLKALGWRSRRIIVQVIGESVAMGLLGAAAGVGLGYAGAAIIDTIAPNLSARLTTSTGQQMQTFGPSGAQSSTPTVAHTVSVPWHAPVSVGAIGLAVILAVLGGLLSGVAGSWRIAQLRPADALSRVA
jgi:putative ABC transport system permease protein